MLRYMKQKALERGDEKQVLLPRVVSNTSDMGRTKSAVVSHVPVSVTSPGGAASTNSSISSNGDDHNTNDIVMVPQHMMLQGSERKGKRSGKRDSTGESSEIRVPSSPSEALVGGEKTSTATSTQANTVYSNITEKGKYVQPNTGTEGPALKKMKITGSPSTHSTQSNLSPLLLCSEHDASMLNPLHVFIRKQIEVFAATSVELQQPAPGRKQPIKLNQVGLRCIHCRDQPNRKRVKRAVCYPSSVSRVYHSVSDMKFDHFSNCKHLPSDVKAEFENLKAEGKKSSENKASRRGQSSSTAQYYHDAAKSMGMVDGPGGIFMGRNRSTPVAQVPSPVSRPLVQRHASYPYHALHHHLHLFGGHQRFLAQHQVGLLNPSFMASAMTKPPASLLHQPTLVPQRKISAAQPREVTTKIKETVPLICKPVLLSEEQDHENLNKLHCFVRKHVEIFKADEEAISAPAPGRKTRVVLGQVGIRCIHCAKLPLKQRVKRAVCYPPSVSGIYHSVSNMKFDHFGICKGLPDAARSEFTNLKNSLSRRGSSGHNTNRVSASSTAQYYQDSATRKGLVDSESGIRFGAPLTKSVEKESASKAPPRDMSPGLSALVRAVSQAA